MDIVDTTILAIIAAKPEEIKVNDLAALMNISRQTISKRVNDLATARYINHAGTRNTITEKGKAYLAYQPIRIQLKEE